MTYPEQINSLTFYAETRKEQDICIVLDKELKYVFANAAACRQLGKSEEQLTGKSILDPYPQIIASRNHRNMLRALSGIRINDPALEGPDGYSFRTEYKPLISSGKVMGLLVKAHEIRKLAELV
jgi:PAS domain S-box-containing protein